MTLTVVPLRYTGGCRGVVVVVVAGGVGGAGGS